MNHRLCRYYLVAFGALVGLAGVTAAQQVVIPAGLRTANTIAPADKATIEKFVKAEVEKLMAGDADASRSARDRLADTPKAAGQPNSTAFLGEYAGAVNAELVSALGRYEGVRHRLNAAIVAAKVADACQNGALEPTVQKLLDSKQPDAVKLWGVRAARGVLPELMRNGRHKKLLDAVLATIATRPEDGTLATEGFEALTRSEDKAVIAAVADPLIAMAEKRIALYKARLAIAKETFIEDPYADSIAPEYLVRRGVWKQNLDAARQVKVMQVIVDLLAYAAHRADAVSADRAELMPLLMRLCSCVVVAADHIGDQNLRALANAARNAVQTARRESEVVNPLIQAILGLPQFKNVVAPKIEASVAPAE